MWCYSSLVILSSLYYHTLTVKYPLITLKLRKKKWSATWQNQQSECAPSEDSDQPGHLPCLIRVFAVRMKKACVLSYPLSSQRRLIRLGGCPLRLIWVFAGRTVILLVLSCRGSFVTTCQMYYILTDRRYPSVNQCLFLYAIRYALLMIRCNELLCMLS